MRWIPRAAAYITGYTSSHDFPVIGGVQTTSGGGLDAFAAKLDAKGATWLYSTYLGGQGDDVANGIAVDSQGIAYIAGSTTSADFPLKNPAQSRKTAVSAGFLAEIGADGGSLSYSSYLGGGARISAKAIALDSHGVVYIAGGMTGETAQAFVLKTVTDGSQPEFFRTAGTGSPREATSIAVDPQGAIYVAGWAEETGSARFSRRSSGPMARPSIPPPSPAPKAIQRPRLPPTLWATPTWRALAPAW